MPRPYPVVEIDGVLHQPCYCQIHEGELLPLDCFYKRGNKKYADRPRSKCKQWERLRLRKRPPRKRLRAAEYRWVLIEVCKREGVLKGCRLIGISPQAFYGHKNYKTLWIRREVAVSAVRALAQLRALDNGSPV